MAADAHGGLVRIYVVGFVHVAQPDAPEHRLRAHFRWEALGVQASSCHSQPSRDLPRPLGRFAPSAAAFARGSAAPVVAIVVPHRGGGVGEMLLALPALCGGDPGALDVGGALEAAALAAGPAPHVGAVLLGLVAAVLAAHPPAADSQASSRRPLRHGRQLIGEARGGVQLLLPLDLVVLPELEASGVTDVLAPASANAVKKEALGRRDPSSLLLSALLLAATAPSEKKPRHDYSPTGLVIHDP
ncbi:hypothetical protein BHE74_00053384 [Ensete ventricosum]|nr:hypothetical protein BHE74_00053384 [Ensete ventricosum]RZS24147.1 hypothetical protein BHM03_00057190 [Ensete ventricosum]